MPLVQVRRAPAPAPSAIASSRNSRLRVTRNAAIFGRFVCRGRGCHRRQGRNFYRRVIGADFVSEDLQCQSAPQPSGSCWIRLRQHPSDYRPLNPPRTRRLQTRRLVGRVALQPRARRSELGRMPPMFAPRRTLGQSRHQRAIKSLGRSLSRQWPSLLGSFSPIHNPLRDESTWRYASQSPCALSPACPTPLKIAKCAVQIRVHLGGFLLSERTSGSIRRFNVTTPHFGVDIVALVAVGL